MNNKPLISVIVPSFNAIDYLRYALRSALDQNHLRIELIVVDDCSNDGSWEYLTVLALSDERIRVFQTEANSGTPAEPRNIGMALASGDYIAFLDCDDVWHPHKLSAQIALMLKKSLDFSCSQITKFYTVPTAKFGEADLTGSDVSRLSGELLLKKNIVATSSVVFKRTILGSLQFSTDARDYGVEDYKFWLDLLTKKQVKAGFIKSVLVAYRITDGSLSRSKIRMAVRVFRFLGRYRVDERKLGLKRYFYFATYLYGAVLAKMYR